MQSAPASYVRAGRGVNRVRALRTLEATFLCPPETCEDLDKWRGQRWPARLTRRRPRKRTVLTLELALHPRERLQRAVERGGVVRGHHARSEQRAAGWHGRVQRTVREDAGVVQGAPEQRRPPVVAHEHGHDRGHD